MKNSSKMYSISVSEGSYLGPPYQLDGGWRSVVRGPGFEERVTSVSLELRILAVPHCGKGVRLPLHGVSARSISEADLESAYHSSFHNNNSQTSTSCFSAHPHDNSHSDNSSKINSAESSIYSCSAAVITKRFSMEELIRRQKALAHLQQFAELLQETSRQIPVLRLGDSSSEIPFGGPNTTVYANIGALLKRMQGALQVAYLYLKKNDHTTKAENTIDEQPRDIPSCNIFSC
eukprot:TRINITY_DN106624_c0_g1_i2.p1 TRINITY_DN106624_c0_g1~~TRINITY_DN106624_c0_g1_i2.p1  ORF type:complete len:233 (+),score=30.84 TRINITY_DN106624_c0_g1_i2:60-758(+)